MSNHCHRIQCGGSHTTEITGRQSTVLVRFTEIVEWATLSAGELVPFHQVCYPVIFRFTLSDLLSDDPPAADGRVLNAVGGAVSCHYAARDVTTAILNCTRRKAAAAAASHNSLLISMEMVLTTTEVVSDSDEEMDRLYDEAVEISSHKTVGACKASIDALQRVKFRAGEKQSMCPICIDMFSVENEIKKLPCRHLFHGDCIDKWLQRRNSCPLCRLPLQVEIVAAIECSEL